MIIQGKARLKAVLASIISGCFLMIKKTSKLVFRMIRNVCISDTRRKF